MTNTHLEEGNSELNLQGTLSLSWRLLGFGRRGRKAEQLTELWADLRAGPKVGSQGVNGWRVSPTLRLGGDPALSTQRYPFSNKPPSDSNCGERLNSSLRSAENPVLGGPGVPRAPSGRCALPCVTWTSRRVKSQRSSNPTSLESRVLKTMGPTAVRRGGRTNLKPSCTQRPPGAAGPGDAGGTREDSRWDGPTGQAPAPGSRAFGSCPVQRRPRHTRPTCALPRTPGTCRTKAEAPTCPQCADPRQDKNRQTKSLNCTSQKLRTTRN